MDHHCRNHIVESIFPSLCRGGGTNGECLARAHQQRCAISTDIRNYKKKNFTKIALNLGDNASVNARQDRLAHGTFLPDDMLQIALGCEIHWTAIAKNRALAGLADRLITGQLNWALELNRGQQIDSYRDIILDIATKIIRIKRGPAQFSNVKHQRQLMALIFSPHSYVTCQP